MLINSKSTPEILLKITKAKKEQLREICDLIHNSIANLCQQDHLNQKHHLDNWFIERSEENLRSLLFSNDSQAFVCIHKQHIVGVSHIKNTGELTLCYVHPQHTGRGIGRLLLQAAEEQALQWGLDEIKLTSTTTAKNFYLSHGYKQYASPTTCIGMTGYPLKKALD